MKKVLLATAIAALSISAAQAYQVELNGSATYNHTDVPGGNADTYGLGSPEFFGVPALGTPSTPGLQGTYYFNQVNDRNGPLAEAAFTQRASNVNASYSYANNSDLETHINSFNAGGEFYVPNSDFYASASIGRNFTKIKGFKQVGVTGYTAEVGLLPINNLLVAVGVAGLDTANENETDPTIRAKYLTKLNNNDVNIEGNVRVGDGFNMYGISGDYYLDRTLSIGASYNLTTVDNEDDIYSVGLNARKFIAQNISVQGGVNFGKAVGNADNFGLMVGGTYRF